MTVLKRQHCTSHRKTVQLNNCNTGGQLTSQSTAKDNFDDTLTVVTGPGPESYIKMAGGSSLYQVRLQHSEYHQNCFLLCSTCLWGGGGGDKCSQDEWSKRCNILSSSLLLQYWPKVDQSEQPKT